MALFSDFMLLTMKYFFFYAALANSFILCSCGLNKIAAIPNDLGTEKINPFPAGTYDHFKAEKNYPKTYNIYKNEELLSQTNSSNSSLIIDISLQRAMLYNGDIVALDYPISSGTESHPTPPGDYKILEKTKDKRSNAYGKIVDTNGDIINADASARKSKVPAGSEFVGAPMPYWMRLTWDGVGHHVGNVPRYPASHACIRGSKSVVPLVFSKVKIGTLVKIVP